MGAAVAKAGLSIIGAAGLVPKPGADAAIVSVRIGRVLYIGTAAYIAGCWYWGWRNERADSGEFPIPGVYKGSIKNPGGAPDAGDAESFASLVPGIGNVAQGTPGNTSPGAAVPGLGNAIPSAPAGGLTGTSNLLIQLGNLSKSFGLTPTEHPKFGGVHPVHVPGSYHNKGRAIDFAGPIAKLAAFTAYVDQHYRQYMAEIIWAGPQPVAVKNGKSVPSSVYAAVWDNHRTHSHMAI